MAQDVADAAVKEIMGGAAQIGDPAIIGMLTNALALAQQGKLGSVAILQVSVQGQIGMQVAGSNVAALVAASVQLTKMLTDQLFNPQKRGNGIVLPPGH